MQAIRERQRNLAKALIHLKRGEKINGEPLMMAPIAAEAHAFGRNFATEVVKGQTIALQKIKNRRFKG